MFIFSVSYPPVRAFSDSGRRLRPRTEQRSCRSAIPAKLSARWQKNAVQRHGARHFVTRLKSGFRGARRTRGCSQSGDLRFLPLFGQRLTAVSARRVFCPFGPQKTANRGLRPRKLMYFLTAKSTKNSPADASAYFVPSNVRNGRLFAGLQANRPRFLPLLAGPSFHSFGIGPGSFAAKRGGRDASGTSRKHRSLRSPPRGGVGRTKRQQKTRRLPGCKQPAPLKPRRSGGRSQGLGRTKRLKGPAVAGLRRSLSPKGSDTPRAKTAECFMYSR